MTAGETTRDANMEVFGTVMIPLIQVSDVLILCNCLVKFPLALRKKSAWNQAKFKKSWDSWKVKKSSRSYLKKYSGQSLISSSLRDTVEKFFLEYKVTIKTLDAFSLVNNYFSNGHHGLTNMHAVCLFSFVYN